MKFQNYLFSGALALCLMNAPSTFAAPQTAAGGHAHGAGMAHGATVHTHTTRLRFSSQPAVIRAGERATWTLQIVDNVDLTPVNDFEIVHDKKLHLIVVSSDLSWFNHLHPEFAGDGKFVISTTLPRTGKYRLYADYKPQGEEGEVALHEFEVKSASVLPAAPKLIADKIEKSWIVKTSRSAPEGETPAPNAPQYQVALMPMPAKFVAGQDVMLHFQVRDAKGKPLKKLEPYLGAMGHCVILAPDPRLYLHTHPMEAKPSTHGAASGGADVMFHTNFPKPGLYKIWGQFQHGGKIITAPFVVSVAAAQTAKAPAMKIPANAQRVTVKVDGGYAPATVQVKAGVPVAMTFHRKAGEGCGGTVVFPKLGIKKQLPDGQKTVVVFTPKQSGTLRFTCGMDMYRGTLVVK